MRAGRTPRNARGGEKRGEERAARKGPVNMRANARLLTLMTVSALALSACQEGTSASGGVGATDKPATAGAPASSSTRIVDHDVEAPDVFQTTEQGLWDGRPSLGGVWAASPDAKDPERVIIRNTDNGKFVIGALFRRERDNPGPKIQISSDAADALGMIAGKPAKLNITALRREDAAPATGAAPILDSAETVSAEGMDANAVSAAIDKAEAKPGAKPGATPAPGAKPAAAGSTPAPAASAATTAAAGAAATGAAAASEPPKKKRWWQRDKAKAADTAAPATPAPTEAGTKPASAAPAAVATAPLDTAPAKPASTKPATPAAAAPAPAASGGKGGMIQLGIFSVEANAKRAAEMVKKAGGQATVRTERSNGKIFWTVVAGPANSPAEREALMAKVQGLGFKDAYYVSR